MKANCKKKLPQVGTGCTAAGESHTEPSSVSPSYSGGGNNRLTPSVDARSLGGSSARGVESSAETNTSASSASKGRRLGDAGLESNWASAATDCEEVASGRRGSSFRDRPTVGDDRSCASVAIDSVQKTSVRGKRRGKTKTKGLTAQKTTQTQQGLTGVETSRGAVLPESSDGDPGPAGVSNQEPDPPVGQAPIDMGWALKDLEREFLLEAAIVRDWGLPSARKSDEAMPETSDVLVASVHKTSVRGKGRSKIKGKGLTTQETTQTQQGLTGVETSRGAVLPESSDGDPGPAGVSNQEPDPPVGQAPIDMGWALKDLEREFLLEAAIVRDWGLPSARKSDEAMPETSDVLVASVHKTSVRGKGRSKIKGKGLTTQETTQTQQGLTGVETSRGAVLPESSDGDPGPAGVSNQEPDPPVGQAPIDLRRAKDLEAEIVRDWGVASAGKPGEAMPEASDVLVASVQKTSVPDKERGKTKWRGLSAQDIHTPQGLTEVVTSHGAVLPESSDGDPGPAGGSNQEPFPSVRQAPRVPWWAQKDLERELLLEAEIVRDWVASARKPGEAMPKISDVFVMPWFLRASGARPQKKWWSPELASLREEKVAARRRYSRFRRRRTRPPDAETIEEELYKDYKAAKTVYDAAILRAKELVR